MLHEFRQRLDLNKLRCVNRHLLTPVLEGCSEFAKTVSLIDATDLPAATDSYKKILSVSIALIELTQAHAVAKTDKVAISSDIRNTRCGCGFDSIIPAFC
jgi:hypothetical protein